MLTAEQMLAAQKANVETLFGLTGKAFEGIEKLVELNLQVAKTALGEATENTKAVLSVKDAQELLALQAGLLQPAARHGLAPWALAAGHGLAYDPATFIGRASLMSPVIFAMYSGRTSRCVTLPRECTQIHSPAALGTRYSQSSSSLTPLVALPMAMRNTSRSSGWFQRSTSSPEKVDSRGGSPSSAAQFSLK